MNEVTSKGHHYIPKFYLNGFADKDEGYYIFDKKEEKIFKSHPKKSFIENNRNTGTIGNEKSSLLEEMYSHFEGDIAPYIIKLRNTPIKSFHLDTDTLAALLRFIPLMYWRIPHNDKKLDELIDKLTFEESGFQLINKETGESDSSIELENQMKSVDLFRKMYPILFPLLSNTEKFRKKDYNNWSVYYRGDNNQITGDNPIILREFIDFGSLNEEVFFPLSMNQVLLHTRTAKPQNIPALFFRELDLLLLHQATRFICCKSKKYLEFLVKEFYPILKLNDFKSQMTERVFQYFK